MVKRSYEKEKNLPNGHDFFCRRLYNYEINKYPKNQVALTQPQDNLSPSGKKLINEFITEHNKYEDKVKDDEEQLYIYKHSKPPVNWNKWKFSNHVIEEFSKPKVDEVYAFKEPVKMKYQYTVDPFRRPKDQGDYFDKHIGIL